MSLRTKIPRLLLPHYSLATRRFLLVQTDLVRYNQLHFRPQFLHLSKRHNQCLATLRRAGAQKEECAIFQSQAVLFASNFFFLLTSFLQMSESGSLSFDLWWTVRPNFAVFLPLLLAGGRNYFRSETLLIESQELETSRATIVDFDLPPSSRPEPW
jgi:hypothetical protein